MRSMPPRLDCLRLHRWRYAVSVYKSSVGERKYGNFFDASYRSILKKPGWRHRLNKVRTAAGHLLPQSDAGWRELDSSMSSDALLMNVFCCRRVTQSRALALKLGFEVGEVPECGFRAGIPRDVDVDRTEIDESYRDLREVFDRELLPRPSGRYAPHPRSKMSAALRWRPAPCSRPHPRLKTNGQT